MFLIGIWTFSFHSETVIKIRREEVSWFLCFRELRTLKKNSITWPPLKSRIITHSFNSLTCQLVKNEMNILPLFMMMLTFNWEMEIDGEKELIDLQWISIAFISLSQFDISFPFLFKLSDFTTTIQKEASMCTYEKI